MSDLKVARRKGSTSPAAIGSSPAIRANPQGEAYTNPVHGKMHAVMDEGSYYQGFNATKLTGVTSHIVTAFDATKPALMLKNTDSPTSSTAKTIYLDFLRMLVTTPPASATALHAYGYVDDIERRSSAGTLINPACSNPLDGVDQSDTCYVGVPIAVAAGTNIREVLRCCPRSVILVVKDEIIFDFGGERGGTSVSDIAGTTAKRLVVPCAPVVVPPGCTFLLHFALPSNATTALDAEWEIAYWKR